MTVRDILSERARLSPNKIALIDVATGERFTYSQLNERATRCASVWAGLGLRPGDRIGILAHNCVEYVDAFFAAGRSGIILVALNPRQTAHELAQIVSDSGLNTLMYSPELHDSVRELRELCSIPTTVTLGDGTPGTNYSEACARTSVADFNPYASQPDDVYCLLYTSGTTGRPKGVMIPHRQVIANAYNTVVCWGLREDDVAPIITPMCHAGGLFVFLTPIFLAGGTIALHRGFDAGEVWSSLEKCKYTVLMAVPTIFKMLADHPAFTSGDLSSVRWFISGGAPLPLYLIDAYQRRGVTFKQGYGLTEVGVNCFAMDAGDSINKPGSIGTPMIYTEASLRDDNGRQTAPGEIGELWLRGPHVCLGYWNNPEATDAAIDQDGWFHTGDQARRDSDGFFYIAGRSKDMFISGGLNVYPAEVEATLLLHPEIQDAAVIGVAHEKWGEVGAAFVVRRSGSRIDAQDIITFLSSRMSRYKLPQTITFLDQLPRTPYGKVLKAELKQRYAADAGGSR